MGINLNRKDDSKSQRDFHTIHIFFLYLIDKMCRKRIFTNLQTLSSGSCHYTSER